MATKTMQSKDAAISDVLNQNVEAAEQIKAAASELEVVHAVLSTKVQPKAAEGDLQAAVERTAEIEQQLSETAQALDKSNEMLREIDANQGASTPAKK
ncbi:hypothetical protein [Acidovorax radicis]|uniref:hypothetical protein n=1 Tax=Acidovorax radicis TaxID=758826 RepID=UPI000555A4CE|nr:hypothetical protein [Acidovorax radicis]